MHSEFIVGFFVSLCFAALLTAVVKAVQRKEYGAAAVPTIASLLLGWFLVRYWGIIGGGVGGFETNPAGNVVGSPINFIQESARTTTSVADGPC